MSIQQTIALTRSNSTTATDMLRSAASLLICAPVHPSDPRASESEFRVLMLKRNSRGLFGNLHVFPGGAVDVSDLDGQWDKIIRTGVDVQQSAPQRDLRRFAVAAIRETFEECGLSLLEPAPKWTESEAAEWRNKVHEDASTFTALCTKYKTAPSLSKLVHWAHWITPEIEKKRFDTQFFLTVLPYTPTSLMPEGSQKNIGAASADGQETVSLGWYTPKEALEAFGRKEMRLFPPQFLTLLELQSHTLATLESYLPPTQRSHAKTSPITSRPVEAFLPEPVSHDVPESEQGSVLAAMALPGDELHSTAAEKGLEGSGAWHRVLIVRDMDEARKRVKDEAENLKKKGIKEGNAKPKGKGDKDVGAVAGITGLRLLKRGPVTTAGKARL
ncbi:Nucleoside diphosphate-linked moiety X motif 19, mitochondrial [Phlyctochytrium planicorne]|nr:Nucleoside diphosphate-linked moiety X motif 19, mitochondrial [Phlyctochytrium planicorne]